MEGLIDESIHTGRYTIALFQSGLNENYEFFCDTLNLIASSSSIVVKYNGYINMSKYNPDDGLFYRKSSNGNLYVSQEELDIFRSQITSIVNMAVANNQKTVLVRTYLNMAFNEEHDLDSIANQKQKLIKIIDEIKTHPNMDIILVGHSQGGLVNLEAGIARNTIVDRIISISTPYSPVLLARVLLFVDLFSGFGDVGLINDFLSSSANRAACRNAIDNLCSNSYFNNLKNCWNNLSIKPALYVITGVSGLICSFAPNMGGGHPTYYYEPFDGLVRISEQRSIPCISFYDLVADNVPCKSLKQYTYAACRIAEWNSTTCSRNCPLGVVDVSSVAFSVLFTLIDNVLHGNGVGDSSDYEIITICVAGMNHEQINVPEQYRALYDIFDGAYSHGCVFKSDEVIATLISLLN